MLSWIYIYPWFDYCPSPSCLKRWANPCLSLINWVNPYLLNNANGITRTAIGMTNKQKHAQFHHVAVPLSEPCRQMSLSEPKHTNTTVLLLLSANYNSKWIFFCACVILARSSGNQNTPTCLTRELRVTVLCESHWCLLLIHALT